MQSVVSTPDTEFTGPEWAAPGGTPDYPGYLREYMDAPAQDIIPMFPGQDDLSYNPDFSRLRGQLEDGNYPAYVGAQRMEWVDLEGVNANATDPWEIHAGDTNQIPRVDYTSGTPARGHMRLLRGPNVGGFDPWTGYVAKLRTPQFGQPGPNVGYLGADAGQNAQTANEQAVYANQLSEQAIYNSLFGG